MDLPQELLQRGEVTLPMPGEHVQRFRLALDELYEPASGLQSLSAQADAAALLAQAEERAVRTGIWPGLVLYPVELKERRRDLARVLTGRLLVRLKDPAREPDLAAAGLEGVERPSYSPEHRIVQSPKGNPLEALRGIQRLMAQAPTLVASVTPLLKSRAAKKTVVPNDPLFSSQWHLVNTGSRVSVAGVDARVPGAWTYGQGEGIVVAVIDEGIQMSHPDLVPNINMSGLHVNLLEPMKSAEPDPLSSDAHGTAVAGIIAARSNNGIGLAGVAPKASLVSILHLGGEEMTDDSQDATTAAHQNDKIAVKNNSWGAPDGAAELFEAGPLFHAAMENAAKTGRRGLGVVSVWASGNGRARLDQGSKDSYANSIYGICVGAVGSDGKLTFYSEGGPHLTCVGPSGNPARGLLTTDLLGQGGYNPENGVQDLDTDDYSYTGVLMGTSFSAPVVSGVCALMLEANPALSWRDVKEILLRTSREIDPSSSGWVRRAGNRPGVEIQALPPIKHHLNFGGGLVQAQAAVELARRWVPLGTQLTVQHSFTAPTQGTNGSSPQAQQLAQLRWTVPGPVTPPPSKAPPKGRTVIYPIDLSNQTPLRAENVQLTLALSGVERKDLTLVLRSPTGTSSVFFTPSTTDLGKVTSATSYTSMRHWGEPSHGIWQLEITDHRRPQAAFDITSVKLIVTGTAVPYPTISTLAESQVLVEGQPVDFSASVSVPNGMTVTRQWWKDGVPLRQMTGDLLPNIGQRMADAGLYEFTVDHPWGRASTGKMAIGVMKPGIPDVTVVEGRTATLTCTASGPGLTYQWYSTDRGVPLSDTARISGTRSARLIIQQAQPADEGRYHCIVSVSLKGTPVVGRATLPGRLTLLRLPVLDLSALASSALVGRELDRRITASSSVTRWTVSGLPPGVRFDATTGRLLGQPMAPGFYSVTITASNAIGTTPPQRLIWEVQGPPEAVMGTFHGLLDRHTTYNGGLGGSLTITVAPSAVFTGRLTRGMHVHAITGTLVGSTDPAAPWLGTVSLPRRSPYSPLRLSFSINPNQARLTGTLSDPALSLPDEASVVALRAAFSTRVPAYGLAGRWHAAYELPQASIGNASLPQGAGWAVQTVSLSGTAQWMARLADGSSVTLSAGLAQDGSLPVHAMLYGNLGSVQGWQRALSANHVYQGSLDWLKLAVNTGTNYPSGFPLHTITGAGGLWVAPTALQRLFDIPLAPLNSRLTFREGGLAQSFQQRLTLTAGNVLQIASDPLANPHALAPTLTPATGILQGTGRAMDIDPLNPSLRRQRPGTFSGLCIPGRRQAVGHFLLPSSSASGAPVLSGSLIWEPMP